jgi:hypothetical protein
LETCWSTEIPAKIAGTDVGTLACIRAKGLRKQ